MALLSGLFVAMTMGAVIGLMMVLWPRVAICEDGVIFHGVHFAPWKRVRKANWDPVDPTLLRIQFYRQCAELIVPPEQRDAVEKLLKEKLRDNQQI